MPALHCPIRSLSPAISVLQLIGKAGAACGAITGRNIAFMSLRYIYCLPFRRQFVSLQHPRPHYIASYELDSTPPVQRPRQVWGDRPRATPPISSQGPATMSPSSALAQASVRSLCAHGSRARRSGGNVGSQGIFRSPALCLFATRSVADTT